jgi:hypothetical protein
MSDGCAMDDVFTQALDEWTAFYALMGGAAATLLGLLFVAVSLRLNIFHQSAVEDVRNFAAVTMVTFLMAIAIAALVLAPHQHVGSLALALGVIGLGGLLAIGWVVRAWVRLNPPMKEAEMGYSPRQWEGWAFIALMGVAFLGMLAVAFFLWNEQLSALGGLAVIECWLLGMGTIASWVTLSHAGEDGGNDGQSGG